MLKHRNLYSIKRTNIEYFRHKEGPPRGQKQTNKQKKPATIKTKVKTKFLTILKAQMPPLSEMYGLYMVLKMKTA